MTRTQIFKNCTKLETENLAAGSGEEKQGKIQTFPHLSSRGWVPHLLAPAQLPGPPQAPSVAGQGAPWSLAFARRCAPVRAHSLALGSPVSPLAPVAGAQSASRAVWGRSSRAARERRARSTIARSRCGSVSCLGKQPHQRATHLQMNPRSSPFRLFVSRPQVPPKDRERKRAGRRREKIPHNQSSSLFTLELPPGRRAHPLSSERPPPAATPPSPAGAGQSRRSSPPTRPPPPCGGPAHASHGARDSPGAVAKLPSHAAEAGEAQRSGVCRRWFGSF